MDRRRRQLSLHLDSFTALSIFLIAFWEPKSGFSWPLFIPVGLGKACFLPSLTNPAQRGQDGTTSFGKLAPSRSIESRFPSDQASSLKSLEIPIPPFLSCFLKTVPTPTLPPLPKVLRQGDLLQLCACPKALRDGDEPETTWGLSPIVSCPTRGYPDPHSPRLPTKGLIGLGQSHMGDRLGQVFVRLHLLMQDRVWTAV